MRKVIITIFAALYVTVAFGQEKTKLAVYVNGSAGNEEKKVVSSQIISTIVKSNKYAAVERTADFLAELRRESGYQYSGNVDDGQLIKLGKQFGVGKICVADVNRRTSTNTDDYCYCYYYGDYYSVVVRMIDIETGLVISVVGEHDVQLGLDKLISTANDLTTKLLQNVTTTTNKQKMAIYVTKNSDSYKAKCVSSQLTENITNMGAFITVDRTSDFLAEVKYQSSGNVDDTQLSRLGKQFGVNLVCVIDITKIESNTYTTVRIIDVETGVIMATSEKKAWTIEWSSYHDIPKSKHMESYYQGYNQGWCYCQFAWKDNLDEITSELMQQLGVCAKKDQKTFGINCCNGLKDINGICRDRNSFLKVSVAANDMRVKAGDVIDSKCSTCPDGYRLPTKEEMERMWKFKEELRLNTSNYYLTSDFRIKKSNYNYKKKKQPTLDYVYIITYWDDGEKSLERALYEYPEKGKNPKRYDYEYKNLYIRCVKD